MALSMYCRAWRKPGWVGGKEPALSGPSGTISFPLRGVVPPESRMVKPSRTWSRLLGAAGSIQAMFFSTWRAVTNLGGLALRKVPLKSGWVTVETLELPV